MEKKKTKTQERPTRQSNEQKIQRAKKRRRKRIKNRIFCVFLLLLALVCASGIVYEGMKLRGKGTDAAVTKQENSADTEETLEKETASQTENTPEEEPVSQTESTQEKEDSANEEDPAVQKDAEERKPEDSVVMAGDMAFHGGFLAEADENTVVPPETEVLSTNSLLIDLSTDTIIAAKEADTRIYPASMTKILTVLVAAEHVTNLDDTFTMTSDITGYCLTNGCSAAGFVGGETIPVRDLFYGTILPSGGEAAVGLATYVAGSQEAFVELMNAKLEELGLSDTAHFTNCVGIYDDQHYCTVMDMAMILKAAVENDWCREVLSCHVYTTKSTEQNPEGIVLSNWFLRRIEDKDCGGEVLCAKTGFVAQSGDCAASYEISAGGKPYICVTVNTYSSWRCIYDHVAMYRMYAK